MAETLIEIGAIASAHGIKGQFKVKAFCDDPMAVTSYGSLHLGDGRVLTLRAHSHAKGFVLCSAKEVTSRNQAEGLRGQLLYVAREAMPEPADDEFYHADVMGYTVIATAGALIGKIVGIYDFGAGTVIEIERNGKKPIMVPFGDAYHLQIEDGAKSVTMDIAPDWLEDDGKKPASDKRGGQ